MEWPRGGCTADFVLRKPIPQKAVCLKPETCRQWSVQSRQSAQTVKTGASLVRVSPILRMVPLRRVAMKGGGRPGLGPDPVE